ncbi:MULTISPECIES: DUF2141 domain-containing protein [unclassified Lentimicrobium]|uniref:DUF2141 domain-containing protein n=1 Tax=unclassified Lentimicrobium TaxID=2677434 RepID=UPI001551B29E|nr:MULTISPECIES: DUF2141 domain-containing protein [unclassified Lentimicrobium]NPD45048.1 DUF2141 domain-containing protein [Lentimicrobium sp. S6]NPD84554.1 DUF2141 domain-containing protein [Lentimicrobium sp. L6]
MKSILISLLFTLSIASLYSQSANLTIIVNGIQNAKGTMNFAVYDNAENYDKSKDYFIGESIPVESMKFEFVFYDLPYGKYAISLFHDEDEDGDLDTNWIGMPKELFGFSNNAKAKMGPPDFEDACFEINGDMELVINLVDLF